jgi:putative transposase
VRAHLAGKDDELVTVQPALDRVGDFAAFLKQDFDEDADYLALRRAESVGRPIGDADWLRAMEARTGRVLAPAKRGPRRKGAGSGG